MKPAIADALKLLREVHDVLESTSDSDLDYFESDEEEREAVPVQYAARKLFQAIQLLEATPGVAPSQAPSKEACAKCSGTDEKPWCELTQSEWCGRSNPELVKPASGMAIPDGDKR